MAIIRCPYCNIQGNEYLCSEQVNNMVVIYCSQCGAIHGATLLLASVAQVAEQPQPLPHSRPTSQPTLQPKPPALQPKVAHVVEPPAPSAKVEDLFDKDLSDKQPYMGNEVVAKMRAMQMYNPSTRYMPFIADDGLPICNVHKTDMTKMTVPKGHKNAGRELWVCERYAECQQWELAPLPEPPRPKCPVCQTNDYPGGTCGGRAQVLSLPKLPQVPPVARGGLTSQIFMLGKASFCFLSCLVIL